MSFVPNRGVRVRTIARDELRQAFMVRAELEALVTGLATPRMTEGSMEALAAADERFAELTGELLDRRRSEAERTRLTGDWVRANYRFHDVIYEAAAVPLVEGIAKSARAGRRSTISTARTSTSTARSGTRSPPAAPTEHGRSPTSTCSTRAACSR